MPAHRDHDVFLQASACRYVANFILSAAAATRVPADHVSGIVRWMVSKRGFPIPRNLVRGVSVLWVGWNVHTPNHSLSTSDPCSALHRYVVAVVPRPSGANLMSLST